ncbi:MAG: cell division protein FtsL [Treponema sp.]|nr:cell division protein FtsL [Treponema sp.]
MNRVRKVQIKKVLITILFLIIAALIPVMLFLYAFQAKRYTDLTKEILSMEQKQEKLIEENKKLVSEISLLSSAERIEKIATEELGMHKAESDDIIRVEITGEKK